MECVTASPYSIHRAITLSEVVFGPVQGNSLATRSPEAQLTGDQDYEPCYAWLSGRTKFWPLFLSIGNREAALWNTAYDGQWSRWMQSAAKKPHADPTDQIHANKVLFSWSTLPDEATFTDYDWWCCILTTVMNNHEPSRLEIKSCFKSSWSKTRWLRHAAQHPGRVQAVVPSLDYRTAEAVWCRNQKTRQHLIALGFAPEKVFVKRLLRFHY